ncbi:Uncharacterised protein [Burkholderia cepacia]|nr:putative membrane protein [Burkholderia cepacia ATCC 25416]SPV07916.1 Uncharacterised protein [Burkholderia cepacia]
MLLFVIAIIATVWLLPPHKSPFAYNACIVALFAMLIAVWWIKGEKTLRRWGKDD